jgi:glycosyltransferase involved in cell wall biosynthesis
LSFKIAIDSTFLSNKGKGISRYVHGLLTNLAPLDHLNQYHVFVDRRFATARLPQQENFHYRPVDFRRNLYWKLVQFPSILNSEHFDVVHLPSESRCMKTRCPSVVTVHEIAQTKWRLEGQKRRGPYQFILHKLYDGIFRRTIPKAQAIIAVSATTRDELLRLYPVDIRRVTVIHEAPEPIFFKESTQPEREKVREHLGAREGYILSFATGDTRENVDIVLETCARVRARLPQKLVLCGTNPNVRRELKKRCQRLGIEDRVVVLDYVSDEVLAGLYGAADLYVDISYYEGFGLQACEAMARGIPVVASNIPAFVEVLDSAAILVPVEDREALAAAMTNILENRQVWQERSRLSRERARIYSWRLAAESTLAVYHTVANQEKMGWQNAVRFGPAGCGCDCRKPRSHTSAQR